MHTLRPQHAYPNGTHTLTHNGNRDRETYLPQSISSPPLGWLEVGLSAPNVSPTTGASQHGPAVPPLDLQSRLLGGLNVRRDSSSDGVSSIDFAHPQRN